MAKWADYGISKVRYNEARTHIDRVEIRPDNSESFGAISVASRNQVVSAIKRGQTFVTILEDSNGKWHQGQEVHLVTVNWVEYLRTDRNNRGTDNLENLPEF